MTDRTTEDVLKDADKWSASEDEFIAMNDVGNLDLDGAFGSLIDCITLIAGLSALVIGMEWQPIDHNNPDKYQDVGLWGLWITNNKTGVSTFETDLLYLDEGCNLRNKDGDYHPAWDFDDYTHWQPVTLPTPPKKES